MNSIVTAKYIFERKPYARQAWYYEFRELKSSFSEESSATVASSLLKRYAKLSKSWNKQANSEWICRIYLSAKMILAASMQLASRKYAQATNLRSVDPYLAYYSILSLMRAIILTLPELEWNNGAIITLSHKRILNLATDHIARFDRAVANRIKAEVLELRAARELISYWHPSSGDRNLNGGVDVETTATLLGEMAQFNSELLERSVLKNGQPASFEFLQSYIDQLAEVELHGVKFFDQEDNYRLDYLRRKYPAPPNVQHIMTEGHVEDFFGAWCSQDENPGCFDPDVNWRIIFDVP
jgi:hypothetical protein